MSSVNDMSAMFWGAQSFDIDISKWDVSRVKNMSCMFSDAYSFNCDLSRWDVSSVTNMDHMFKGATSFKRKLCGNAWVNSKATQKTIFEGSSGSISSTVCHTSSPQRWLAQWQIASTPMVPVLPAPGLALAKTICPNCGTFAKSGRVSCCAPGGAWYKNCGCLLYTSDAADE